MGEVVGLKDLLKNINGVNYGETNQRVQDIILGEKSAQIQNIFDNPSEPGTIDSDRANRGYTLCEEVSKLSADYAILLVNGGVEYSEGKDRAKQLKDTEVRLSMYVLKEFIKDIYLNISRIAEYYEKPTLCGNECKEFVKEYLFKIKEVGKFYSLLILNPLLQKKYGVKPLDLIDQSDENIIKTMKARLEKIKKELK